MENQIIKEKMSLADILTTFNQMDAGIIELSFDDMQELGKKAHMKVDGYKDFLDRCDTEIQHLKNKADGFLQAAKGVANTRDRVEKVMLYHLEKNDMKKISGDHFNVSLVTRKASKIVEKEKVEAGVQHFATMPDFITRKFSWNKAEIKKELKKEDPNASVSALFTLQDTTNLKWTVRKGIEQ